MLISLSTFSKCWLLPLSASSNVSSSCVRVQCVLSCLRPTARPAPVPAGRSPLPARPRPRPGAAAQPAAAPRHRAGRDTAAAAAGVYDESLGARYEKHRHNIH